MKNEEKTLTPSVRAAGRPENLTESEPADGAQTLPQPKTAAPKKRFRTARAALVCLFVFTALCGLVYPLGVTLFAQAAFPYEANGSQIVVTLSDGTKKTYGSELIGQSYESARYMFGRVNTGAPTNLSPESEAYRKLVEQRIAERKQKLAAVGYADPGAVPSELVTSSGSGVDPHVSPAAARFQIPAILAARNASAGEKLTESALNDLIDQYTEGRFLWVFGEKRVNVLLVNLSLDGLI